MNEMPTVNVETSGERDAFVVFLGKVNELVSALPEEVQEQILNEAKEYEKKMGEVSDPEEAAQRLVMSRTTAGHIVE